MESTSLGPAETMQCSVEGTTERSEEKSCTSASLGGSLQTTPLIAGIAVGQLMTSQKIGIKLGK